MVSIGRVKRIVLVCVLLLGSFGLLYIIDKRTSELSPHEIASAVEMSELSPHEIASAVEMSELSPHEIASAVEMSELSPHEIASAVEMSELSPHEIASAVEMSELSPHEIASAVERELSPHEIASAVERSDPLTSRIPSLSYNTHIFYYTWFGAPGTDGAYLHWNHKYLPHWNSETAKQFPRDTRHQPPEDIGANFYPSLGCYSSSDPAVINRHMSDISKSGVGVLALSWYPPGLSDEEGRPSDPLVPLLLDIAHNFSIKLTFHIEPYPGRTAASVRRDIEYIVRTYSRHPAFYTYRSPTASERPFFYVYDSYLLPAEEWAQVLTPGGQHSIRGTHLDSVVVGLLVNSRDVTSIRSAGFDGFYTYFASRKFTYGSSPDNWQHLGKIASSLGLIFIPSVGPGYIDTAVRPWNAQNTQERRAGEYYSENFLKAVQSGAEVISITSYNEWHEGTQIEPAVVKENYQDYRPGKPEFYLTKTKELVSKFDHNFLPADT